MLARLGLPDAFHTLFHTLFPYVSHILPLCFEGIYWGVYLYILLYICGRTFRTRQRPCHNTPHLFCWRDRIIQGSKMHNEENRHVVHSINGLLGGFLVTLTNPPPPPTQVCTFALHIRERICSLIVSFPPSYTV